MPLNPDDLFEHEFEETRLRPGYDKGQVNDYLDAVQAELRRLIAENESLRDAVLQQGGAPEFAGGWEGTVEPIGREGHAATGAPGMEPDGFVPAGGGVGAGDVSRARQESEQRVMAALHAAESAEYEAHHRIEAAQRDQARAELDLRRAQERAAGLTAAVDRLERAGEEGTRAGELLAAAQRLHDEQVWAAEERAREAEEHAARRLQEIEARTTEARQRMLESEQLLRRRAEEFAAWAQDQRRHLSGPTVGAGTGAGGAGASPSGASSLWS